MRSSGWSIMPRASSASRPHELRRRNFIKPEAMPHATPLGLNYDSGDFARNMDQALAAADARRVPGAARRGAGARAAIAGSATPSISSSPAFRPTNSPNCASTRPGTLTLLMGTQSSGQGHQTAYAQLAAERLGLPLDKIRVLQGDTDGDRLRPRHRRLALAAGRRRGAGRMPPTS